jgi:hypothetical protein
MTRTLESAESQISDFNGMLSPRSGSHHPAVLLDEDGVNNNDVVGDGNNVVSRDEGASGNIIAVAVAVAVAETAQNNNNNTGSRSRATSSTSAPAPLGALRAARSAMMPESAKAEVIGGKGGEAFMVLV